MEQYREQGSLEISRDFASEILAMAEADQVGRRRWEETGEAWGVDFDRKNTKRLKEIVSEIGWPTILKVGKEASQAAWLLVQHADHDRAFQQHCLDLMKNEAEGEVNKQDIAFLEDRVRVAMGMPTLYGTQFFEDADGEFGPRPIEDMDHLDERRATMGLPTFDEYEREMLDLGQRYRNKEKE
jgi:hypothetical protein